MEREEDLKMRKVLILGAGLVAKPIIEYLLENSFRITVASPMKPRADEMIKGHPHGTALDWSMDDPGTLEKLVDEHDITVSLLPFRYHYDVALVCLQKKKSLVTTSYIQPQMQALDVAARKAGVIFLNEIGLDPGIDHMSAMKLIDHIHSKGGNVEEFYSLCGALPAPEAADNPLRYKFSWSPKGVILASRNSAQYLKDGQRITVESENLFRDKFKKFIPGVGIMEVYPNRDSINFINIYGITEARTVYRGTFRYEGWCETLDAMKRINMFDDTAIDYTGKTFADFISERAGISNDENLKLNLCSKLGLSESSAAINSLDWLGFFNHNKMGYRTSTPFEVTSDQMIRMMPLGNNERDMVLLQHLIEASYPDGKKETITSLMLDYGTPATNTSIARTVSLPAAVATSLILEGKIDQKGVHRPVSQEIYKPVLSELEKLGIRMEDEVT
jgi:saccharopine dehydrogenase (NADP+, L-glutamate forming)